MARDEVDVEVGDEVGEEMMFTSWREETEPLVVVA